MTIRQWTSNSSDFQIVAIKLHVAMALSSADYHSEKFVSTYTLMRRPQLTAQDMSFDWDSEKILSGGNAWFEALQSLDKENSKVMDVETPQDSHVD